MSGLQEFEPDAVYCVHCHAPAAGMCARCGALCCGDCVELRMGLVREQAVCRLCLAEDEASAPAGQHWRRVAWVAAALLAVAAAAWLAA